MTPFKIAWTFAATLLAASLLSAAVAQTPPWSDIDIGAPAAGSHAYNAGAFTVTGSGKGMDQAGKDQLHYTFKPYPGGDVEIIARLVSFTGDPKAQAGIMIRKDNAPDSSVASITFTNQSWQAPDKTLKNWIGEWSRDLAAPYSRKGQGYVTPLVPPLWLRIDRMGHDYAIYKSPDGKIWSVVHNDSGGAFTPDGPIEIGFFVDSGDPVKTATAVFDNIHIGKPDLGYKTSWIGTTYSQDSTGYITGSIGAMVVEPDGTVHTNSYYDEAGEAAKVYKNGRVVRGIGGNNLCSEGSIAADTQHVFLFSGLYGGSIQEIPLDGDPNRNGKTVFMSAPVMGKGGSIISGMAVSNGTLFVSDSRDNKILVANPDAPVHYRVGNSSVNAADSPIDVTGVKDPAPQEVYRTQRECDFLPYDFPGLDPGVKYTVRIHFVDYKHDKPGERFIQVTAGGQREEKYDIAAEAGGKNKAVVKQFDGVSADANGTLSVTFSRVGESPDPHIVVNGIEILKPDGTVAAALNCGGSTAGHFASDVAEMADRDFAFDRPGPMCVDKQGNLWIIQEAADFPIGGKTEFPYKGAVKCYSPDGKFTGREITDVVDPVSVAMDPTNGHVLVADDGLDQNIRIYGDVDTAPKLVSTFGEKGGIWAGKTPGLLNDPAAGGWARFYLVSSIGVDGAGTIYVACAGSGTDLRAYSPAGKLLWKLNALHFVDCGDFDPDSDGVQVYTPFKHDTMDYSKTAPGSEWSYTAWNWNPFKYGSAPRNGSSSAVIRRVGPKRSLVMYTSGQGNCGDILIFRMVGEQAIPCGRISEKGGNEMWLDRNGDGKETPDEVTSIPNRPGGLQSYDVDQKGDIWSVWAGNTFVLRHYFLKGVDANGTPEYGLGKGDYEDIPYPDPGIKAQTWGNLGRVVYDSVHDVMYLFGPGNFRTTDKENTMSYLARYDNWSKGNRKSRWQFILPDPSTDPSFMYTVSMPYGLAYQWEAFDVAGDKVFVAEMWGPVHVYDANTGAFETILNAGPEVSGGDAWEDEQMGIRAFQRKNGEYIILEENSGFHAKNNMFRYRPAK